MVDLASNTLAALPGSIAVPAYDRSAVTASIVHFGVGGFHRAHQAMYVDRVLGAGATQWGICGVGLLPGDAAMRDALAAQDGLYTLVTVAPDGEGSARVIGSLVDYLYAPDDPGAVSARLADPRTRIVSLTITEGGYGVSDATGEFDPHDEATLTDLDGAEPPRSALGFIVAELARRYAAGETPFTVMSCDNMQGNGDVARVAVTSFARRRDPELAEWIAERVAFPNSMVDRITPVTTDATRELVAEEFGIEDRWPVRAESFEQWVLEDSFTLGRPPFEEVGVHIVADVEPYELMKLRLLNASHQAMGYLGVLAGATYVHEVCTDETFVDFLLGYMHGEAIPTLRPVPGIDLDAYCAELIRRFGSVAVMDTLARLVVDGSDRIAKFLVPVVRDQLSRPEPAIAHAALVLASWSVFLEGRTEVGEPTPIVDRRRDEVEAALAREVAEPGAFLDLEIVFGDLGANPVLRSAFVDARVALKKYGAREAMRLIG